MNSISDKCVALSHTARIDSFLISNWTLFVSVGKIKKGMSNFKGRNLYGHEMLVHGLL